MSRSRTDAGVVVRHALPADEAAVLALLRTTLGGGPVGERAPEFFRWKHHDNVFGPSLMLVAEAEERVVGLRALMRWRFRSGERTVAAVRAVDTATHPDFQGRGIFSRLTLQALEELREDTDLVFNTPNASSGPGYLKMGWEPVGHVPVWIRVRRPLRFAYGARTVDSGGRPSSPPAGAAAPAASEVLSHPGRIAPLVLEAAATGDRRLSTARDLEYLRWRYGAAPMLDYRAVVTERGNEVRGLAIFRVRPRGMLWETTMAEVLVRPGDRDSARRLLREVARAARVDHLTCHFSPVCAGASAPARSGFLRAPKGITFVVNPLRPDLAPRPSELRSWALSLGDVEVF